MSFCPGLCAKRTKDDRSGARLLPPILTQLLRRATADRRSDAARLRRPRSGICGELAVRPSEMDALAVAVRAQYPAPAAGIGLSIPVLRPKIRLRMRVLVGYPEVT